MSGASALAADERLAAYDFGPAHPFQAGRLEAGLGLLRAAGVLDEADLLAFGPAADADLELVHDRDYLEALARFSASGPVPTDPGEAVRRSRSRSRATARRARDRTRRRSAPGAHVARAAGR